MAGLKEKDDKTIVGPDGTSPATSLSPEAPPCRMGFSEDGNTLTVIIEMPKISRATARGFLADVIDYLVAWYTVREVKKEQEKGILQKVTSQLNLKRFLHRR